jgi:hypothetical protein
VAHFVVPISPTSPYLPKNASNSGVRTYWDMIAAGVPDMQGSREQSVWFRFQQIDCIAGGSGGGSDSCSLRGEPLYFDTYVVATLSVEVSLA